MRRNSRHSKVGTDRQKEDQAAMEVVMEMAEEGESFIPKSATVTPEQIGLQLDNVLKELGENVNLEDNFNKLREIQGLIEESVSLDALVKQSMMVSINVEVNLQQVDHREKFLEELGRVENADNLLLEIERLKCLGKMLERARATSGVEELKQAYTNKIIDYEIQMKVAAIRRYVFDGQGEVGLKSWIDIQKVESEVARELDARKRNAQFARVMTLIQTTDGPKQEKSEWLRRIKGKVRKAYEQVVDEWETRIEGLENDQREDDLKQDLAAARKALQYDGLLQQFDQATLLAQLDQVILNRGWGDLLVLSDGSEVVSATGNEMKTGQEETKEVPEDTWLKKCQDTEGTDKRKLDEVIRAARAQKVNEVSMFREPMIPEQCRAPTLEEQGICVDNCAISAHRWKSENILIIDISEKWTSMEDLIPLLERMIREQMVDIMQAEDTAGWKQTVRESDWKIWRTQSTACMIIPLAKSYEVNTIVFREGKSILRTEVFSVAKALNSGVQIPVLCCYLPVGYGYGNLVDAVATASFRGGTNEWEAVCSMTQCIRTEGYQQMDSKVLVIPRLINKVITGTDSGRKKWNKEVIFEIYGECLEDDSGGVTEVSFVGPYRFMIGGREQICKEFEPSAALMESYLCTMLEGVRDDALITQIMAQIQLDSPGFDYKSELAGVMDGYDRKRGARRLFLLWHMQTRILTVKKALRMSGHRSGTGTKGDVHIRFEVLKDLPGYLEILSNWKSARVQGKSPKEDEDGEQVMTSKPFRGKMVKTPDNWEVTPKRHTFKSSESQLGCFTVYEELFQKEANANREIRDTVSKHLPIVGRAHNKLVDRHEGLQQRVERTEMFIMDMLKTQGRDPKEFLEYSEDIYKKQQQRPNAVPEFSLPANEKVDVEDMMTMLEKSRKRMKEIDDGKLGDIPADY